MGRIPGNEAVLVGQFPDRKYPALEGEMRDLKTVNLPNIGKFLFLDRAAIRYLRNAAKDIDVLNLYHLSRHTLVYGLIYKMANPKGLLYLKMDAYNSHLQTQKRYAKGRLKNYIFRKLEQRFLKNLTLATVENKAGVALAKKTYPELASRLMYLPNGCNDDFLGQIDKFEDQENIILSVGRIGGDDKNYDLLLKALPKFNLGDWKMRVVGPMTDAFAEKWQAAQQSFPLETARIEFLGPIYDRKTLYEIYAKSKVFFLTSRFESFGIAYVEALYFGAVLVGHREMSAYPDIINQGEFGTYYINNNPDSFAEALTEAVLMSENEETTSAAKKHTEQNFYWSKIASTLNQELQNARK